jgi:hypothetical protein
VDQEKSGNPGANPTFEAKKVFCSSAKLDYGNIKLYSINGLFSAQQKTRKWPVQQITKTPSSKNVSTFWSGSGGGKSFSKVMPCTTKVSAQIVPHKCTMKTTYHFSQS